MHPGSTLCLETFRSVGINQKLCYSNIEYGLSSWKKIPSIDYNYRYLNSYLFISVMFEKWICLSKRTIFHFFPCKTFPHALVCIQIDICPKRYLESYKTDPRKGLFLYACFIFDFTMTFGRRILLHTNGNLNKTANTF